MSPAKGHQDVLDTREHGPKGEAEGAGLEKRQLWLGTDSKVDMKMMEAGSTQWCN